MTTPLSLHAGTRRKRTAQVPFVADLSLTATRVHEFRGLARRSLAMMLATRMQGPVFWIAPAWDTPHLHAQGMQGFVDPGRFTFMTPKRPEDVLWVMEETLRAGIVPLVVADIPAPPALTPVRRLHLAAEHGAKLTHQKGLGLLLTGTETPAPGVESRWRLDPNHAHPNGGWHLTRERHRSDPPKSWHLQSAQTGYRLRDMDTAA